MAGYHGVTTKHTPQILVRVIPDVTTKELEDLGCLDGRWGICVKMRSIYEYVKTHHKE